jgi:hypothetical protein
MAPFFNNGTYTVEYFHMDIVKGLFAIPDWVPQLDVPLLELERNLRSAAIHRDLALTSYLFARRILEQNLGGTRCL